jgi:hypothetical protein
MNNLLVPGVMRCPKCGSKRCEGDLRAVCGECAQKGSTVKLLVATLKCPRCEQTRRAAAYKWTFEDYEAALASGVVPRAGGVLATIILTISSVVSLSLEGWAVMSNTGGGTGRMQEIATMNRTAGGLLVLPTFILALIGIVVGMRASKTARNGQLPMIAACLNAFVMIASIVLALKACS